MGKKNPALAVLPNETVTPEFSSTLFLREREREREKRSSNK